MIKINKKVINFNLKYLDFLEENILSEEVLKMIAGEIAKINNCKEIVFNLMNGLEKGNRNYDWNVGSILQHLDVDLIINFLKDKKDFGKLLDSIGLTWVLGEFNNKNSVIVNYLYKVVEFSKNSDAWWRAAFSLENLDSEDAVNLLKRSLKICELKNLDFYLNRLSDKKSLISILILSNTDNIENKIYPKIKNVFLKTNSLAEIVGCCWLIGRLKLFDTAIFKKLISLIKHSNYELKYYTFFALQNNATEALRPVLEKSLREKDPLIRKMATRGLLGIGNEDSLKVLYDVLHKEKDEAVIAEIAQVIYSFKNPCSRNKLLIEMSSYKNENGLIVDESDKWYQDPAIYNIFSESEDPENICFDLVLQKIKNKKIINPIDLATGTGRMLWQILDKMNYQGTLYGVDLSEKMCEFLKKNIKRERKYTKSIKIINSSIVDLINDEKIKSSFVISSFGFPSKIFNKDLVIEELKIVNKVLAEDGVFVTIGWDETFNDELNEMWFKYIPDNIHALEFEDWRKQRASLIKSTRSCGLSWLKKGILVPLQFASLKEAAFVMGYLFGRDAAKYIIRSGKTEWNMSLGITYNNKKELIKIINSYERN